jgi:hypothetical protein
MKKVALLIALLMVISAAPGWSLVAAVDRALDNQAKSDLRPVEDTAKIGITAKKGIDKSYDMVMKPVEMAKKPMSPILDPILKVKDASVRATKTIINKTWDALTLSHFRKK